MDDLYARLKPPAPALADVDRTALRRSLFGDAAAMPSPSSFGTTTTLRLGRRHPEPRRRFATIAAAALGLAGLSGLVVTMRDGGPARSGPSETVPSAAGPSAVAEAQSVPRVLLDAPGWTLTRVYDVPGVVNGRGRGVTVAPVGTFPNGPWASVDATNGSTDIDATVPPFPGSTVLAIGEQVVSVSHLDRLTEANWDGPDGVSYGLAGWDIDDETARQIAAATTFDGLDSVIVEPPVGWEIVAADVAALLDRSVEYEFTDGTPATPVMTTPSAADAPLAAGRVLAVKPIFGGEFALRSRVSRDRAIERSVDGETLYVEQDDQFTRIHVLRDDWVWEIDVQGVASPDEALALFASLRVVDEEAWRAALPADAVGADERALVVAELLGGVPTPAGFDPTALSGGGTADRYQVIAQVSGAVVCSWLDQWFKAVDAADPALRQEAADALATSRTWPMLIEIADAGGWSGNVWEWAEAVNGGPGVASGAGWVQPTREEAASALGCSF